MFSFEEFPILGLVVLSGLETALFIIFFSAIARRIGLVDQPNDLTTHSNSVPLVGGLVIYLVLISIWLMTDAPKWLIFLILPSGILVVIGVIDDAVKLSVRIRFIAQIIATIVTMFGCNVWLTSIGPEFQGINFALAFLGIPLTIFAVVGLTNAINMIDGIDGLASGQILIAALIVGVCIYKIHGYIPNQDAVFMALSSIFCFWLINMSFTPINKVFLGDAGSTTLGFVFSWILIICTQEPANLMHPVAALWSVAFPVFDTLRVIGMRVARNNSPFASDRLHLHCILMDVGFSARKVLVQVLGTSIVINGLGVWTTYALSPVLSLLWFCIAFGLFTYFCHRLCRVVTKTEQSVSSPSRAQL